MAKVVRPYFMPPTLLLRQLGALTVIHRSTGWRISGRWVKDLDRLLRIAAGAKAFSCFGFSPHPVYEVTSLCNLRCLHCHARGGAKYPGELDTEGALQVINNLTSVKDFRTLVFTGGEPLVRKDIFLLTQHASDLGFNVVYATNGVLITDEVARRMEQSGVIGAAISLDSLSPGRHDWFRGVPGAWRAAISGMENVLRHNMYLQVNITVSKLNIDEFDRIVEFVDRMGAHVILLYTFVAVGRGGENRGLALTPEEAVYVVRRAAELQGTSNLVIAPIGVPWYYAYLVSKSGLPLNVARYFVYGCAAGRGIFYIKPDGEVWPCPFLPISAGNVARDPASKIWNGPLFRSLRLRDSLQGACGSCRFKDVCGGCRARAYIRHGSPYAEDPLCPLSNGANDLTEAIYAAKPTPCGAPIFIG